MHLYRCKMQNRGDFMEQKMLRDYLEKVRLLENDIYTLNQTISLLELAKKRLPNYLPPKEPQLAFTREPEIPSVAGTVVGTLAWSLLSWPGAVYLGYRLHKTAKVKREYNKEITANQSRYEEAIAKYKIESAEYERNYAQAKGETEQFNKNLDVQISTLTENRSLSEAALQKLYDLDIIYRKYRSIIPITMFCEYLDSGIRNELHGAYGMYDLYEQQLLGKQIVGELTSINSNLRAISYQLSSISLQLTGIQQNQVMLYEEIARGNTIASEIAESTKQMVSTCDKHLTSIQNSAEMTAFNAQVTARRTDAIARITEYEFASKHSPYIIP